MGGGGAVRTATKVAGLGINGGMRGAPAIPLMEQAPTARKASRSGRAIASVVNEDGKPAIVLSSSQNKIDSTIQRPSWELDDWEFAGEEELFDLQNPPERVVFGPVPTLEEAQEATSDLKEALEKIYFSSPTAIGSEASPEIVEGPFSLEALRSKDSETKASFPDKSGVTVPSVPKNVLQAFTLLKESPDVQKVVASLTADKNVWEAMMKNEKVTEFFQSQQTFVPLEAPEHVKEIESFAENDEKTFESDQGKRATEDVFTGFFQNIKQQVVEMVTKISEFAQTLFVYPAEESCTGTGKGSTDTNGDFLGPVMGATFIGLSILSIMVVLLKRG